MFINKFIKIICLLSNILYNKFKNKIHNPIRWACRIHAFISSRYNILHSVPDSFIRNILRKSNINTFHNNILIIYSNIQTLSWYQVAFKSQNDTLRRNIQILFSPLIPPQTILCSDIFMFNIKQSLSVLPCETLYLEIFTGQFTEPISLKHAKSINISQVECNHFIESIVLDKAIECFVRSRQYCYKKDLLAIDLELYSPLKTKRFIYISIVEVTGNDIENDGFLISEDTAVYQASSIQSFLPSTKFEFVNNNVASINSVIPLGLENHYRVLVRWFQPFFKNSIKDLKPVFVLSGSSGVGKKILLERTAKKIGIHYCNVDCNDLISSASAQMQANFKSAFKRIVKSGPSVVHFSNVELLIYTSDNNDTGQLLYTLSEHISSMDFVQHVFVLTCEDFSSLPEKLISLVLAHHHIPMPSNEERASMLIWIAKKYSSVLNEDVINYLISETASFVLADLFRLLSLADYQRYKSSRSHFEIQDFTSALEGLSKVEKANVGDVEWEDVGGVENIKKAVLSSIETGKLGGLRRTGLLLHGPPGTGKTLLARAVANQVSAAFIPVKGPELLNMYIGQSEANIRQVFSRAKDAAPCILFFDELDSLAPSRGNQSSGGVMDRVVSQLLSEMDNLEVNDNVFVLAATNRPDLIDPALLRPGRLDKMIYVGPFKERDDKRKVFNAITRKFQFEDHFDYDKIIEILPSEITGAQMNAICYNAWMQSAREIIQNGNVQQDTKVIVGMKHFESSLQTTNINF